MRQITASVCACHPKQEDMYECVQLCDSDNRTLFVLDGDRSNFWKLLFSLFYSDIWFKNESSVQHEVNR